MVKTVLSNFFNSINKLKTTIMSNLLYTVAVILIILWAIGFFAYSAGSIIHILLVIAIVAVLLRLIQGRRL
ncbi:MAG: hypothetical protein C0412_14350 [Flavobacterium sp.]|nr:hypothetical protein [Flavobacterium sp.]